MRSDPTPTRRPRASRAAPVAAAAVAVALALGACAQVDEPPETLGVPAPEPLVERPSGPPAYATLARRRQRQLQDQLATLLREVIPEVREVNTQLVSAIEDLGLPERLLTADPDLTGWHEKAWKDRQTQVTQHYAAARRKLEALHERANARAVVMAKEMAEERSPLDAGETGDVLLDQELKGFDQTLRSELGLQRLDADEKRDSIGRIDLVRVYTSFRDEGADEALGGRLLLFLGGPEFAEGPRAQLVFKPDGPFPKGEIVQVMRHRIMRGPTLVQDQGWRRMPAEPVAERFGKALFCGGLAPRINPEAPGFDQLRDMRVIVDVQTALADGSGLRGGVDWRIEYRITSRGAISWEIDALPDFSADCAEVRKVLGASAPTASTAGS